MGLPHFGFVSGLRGRDADLRARDSEAPQGVFVDPDAEAGRVADGADAFSTLIGAFPPFRAFVNARRGTSDRTKPRRSFDLGQDMRFPRELPDRPTRR